MGKFSARILHSDCNSQGLPDAFGVPGQRTYGGSLIIQNIVFFFYLEAQAFCPHS